MYAITGDPAFWTLRRMFSFFFRMGVVYYTLQKEHARVGSRSDAGMQRHRPAPHILLQQIIPIGV